MPMAAPNYEPPTSQARTALPVAEMFCPQINSLGHAEADCLSQSSAPATFSSRVSGEVENSSCPERQETSRHIRQPSVTACTIQLAIIVNKLFILQMSKQKCCMLSRIPPKWTRAVFAHPTTDGPRQMQGSERCHSFCKTRTSSKVVQYASANTLNWKPRKRLALDEACNPRWPGQYTLIWCLLHTFSAASID